MRRKRSTVLYPKWLFEYRFRCKICGYQGKTWSNVAGHILREHKEMIPESLPSYYHFLKRNIEYEEYVIGEGR